MTERPWETGASEDERWDAYLLNPRARAGDPDFGVLRNLVGARTAAELRRREDLLTEARAVQLRECPVQPTWDLDHLKAIHRRLFVDVYRWAGQLRTVGMSKGGGPSFVAPDQIAVVVDGVGQRLSELDGLRGLGRQDFVHALSVVYDVVNRAHPFREGNGRTQRIMWDQLAHHAGYTLNWRLVHGRENDHASLQAANGNAEPLRSMLGRIVDPVAPPARGGDGGVDATRVWYETLVRVHDRSAHPAGRSTGIRTRHERPNPTRARGFER